MSNNLYLELAKYLHLIYVHINSTSHSSTAPVDVGRET